MSHFTEIRTKIKDKQALLAALKAMKWRGCHGREPNIEVHDTPQHLYGYRGDRRSDKAEIIIRRGDVGSSSNDMGFTKQADGTYKAIISDYDTGKVRGNTGFYGSSWQAKLNQTYATTKVKRELMKKGYRLALEEEKQDGTIHMKVHVYN